MKCSKTEGPDGRSKGGPLRTYTEAEKPRSSLKRFAPSVGAGDSLPSAPAPESARLPDLIAEINAWQRETFPEARAESALAHLREELEHEMDGSEAPDEAADCFFLLVQWADRAGIDLVRPDRLDQFDYLRVIVEYHNPATVERLRSVAKQLGPPILGLTARYFLVLLEAYAVNRGFDLYDEVRKKLEVNKARQWQKPDERGVYHHVK